MTPFAEWLDRELKARRMSKAQLAAYMGKRAQTVYSWFNDDTTPSTAFCREVARVLKVPEQLVLGIAGHVSPEPNDAPADPPWLAGLLPVLRQLDEREARVVDDLAQHLLELREPKAPPRGTQE